MKWKVDVIVEVVEVIVEVMGVVEVIEVSLLFVEVTSLQKSKSLRVIPDSFFNHWMSISKVLSQLVSEWVSQSVSDKVTYWAVLDS